MPPQKPSNADVIAAINELSLTFGAELAGARNQIEALTAEVAGLKELVKVKPYPSAMGPLAAVLESIAMPPELANMHPLSKYEVDLIKDNKKIDAIKAYRARIQQQYNTYVGLKEGKDLICYVADHITSSKPIFDEKNPLPLPEHLKDLVKQGLKIEAIKGYRTYVSTVCAGMCGLKEAKDVIDAYAHELANASNPSNLTAEEAGCLYYTNGALYGKLDAVKAYRHRTGSGLKAGLLAVEKYIAEKTGWIFEGYKPTHFPDTLTEAS